MRAEKPKPSMDGERGVEPELDEGALAILKEQMGEEFPELLQIFRGESAAHLDALAAAIEMGAWKDARRAAHSLKSSAALFGLARLAATMREIEALPEADAGWRARLGQARTLHAAGLARLT
ncbi:MAG: Hpt domain [Thermoplasmata archaeon]|jgi:HPt (histidine-containing phosphotransfer) domain-containing protein|nr:Hpt domain [Thermoplasmata archaeon]